MNNSPFYDQESRRFVPALPKAGQVPAAAKQAGKVIRSRVPHGGISTAMPEPLFSKVLEKLEAGLVAEIRRTIFDMQEKASHERVNRLLELTFKEDLLGLTDVIYEDGTNQFARMHHPDKIVPGWRLVIP